jgi:hypothetical protein
VRDALRIVLRWEYLRRTLTIALVVGTILTAINHADAIASGDATSATLAKAVLNYLVPFIVSNLGLLAGRDSEGGPSDHRLGGSSRSQNRPRGPSAP